MLWLWEIKSINELVQRFVLTVSYGGIESELPWVSKDLVGFYTAVFCPYYFCCLQTVFCP